MLKLITNITSKKKNADKASETSSSLKGINPKGETLSRRLERTLNKKEQ